MDLRTPRADESRLGLESKPEKQPSRQDFEELDIEEGWERLVASRPLGPQILVYGDPLVVAGRHGGGFFCFLCFLQKRTGGYPAGRARVPTTQPSKPGSPHELGGWLDGPGDGRRRHFHGGAELIRSGGLKIQRVAHLAGTIAELADTQLEGCASVQLP